MCNVMAFFPGARSLRSLLISAAQTGDADSGVPQVLPRCAQGCLYTEARAAIAGGERWGCQVDDEGGKQEASMLVTSNLEVCRPATCCHPRARCGRRAPEQSMDGNRIRARGGLVVAPGAR